MSRLTKEGDVVFDRQEVANIREKAINKKYFGFFEVMLGIAGLGLLTDAAPILSDPILDKLLKILPAGIVAIYGGFNVGIYGDSFTLFSDENMQIEGQEQAPTPKE